jgi:hypothetical protein
MSDLSIENKEFLKQKYIISNNTTFRTFERD